MKKVYINDYYIDQEKYNKELNEKRELEKEMYQILKIELEQGAITQKEFYAKVDQIYMNDDNTKRKLYPDSSINYNSNIISGFKKESLEVPYDGEYLLNDNKELICLSKNEVKELEKDIEFYFEIADDLIFQKYSEALQPLIIDFANICCDICELEDYLKENGIKVISNRKRILKKD